MTSGDNQNETPAEFLAAAIFSQHSGMKLNGRTHRYARIKREDEKEEGEGKKIPLLDSYFKHGFEMIMAPGSKI